jgi:hypothetical protein
MVQAKKVHKEQNDSGQAKIAISVAMEKYVTAINRQSFWVCGLL